MIADHRLSRNTGNLDTDLQHRVSSVCQKFSDNVHIIANEPTLALYRLEEHTRKTLPSLVERRIQLSENDRLLEGRVFDTEYDINAVKQIYPAESIFRGVQETLKNCIYMKQELDKMTTPLAEENLILRANLEAQLERLLTQLADLEESKADLDAQEYAECRSDTLDQLKEFQESLTKLEKGDITLTDSVNRFTVAIQAAISNAFQTPDIIRLFAKKQPAQLRARLDVLESDLKTLRVPLETYTRQKLEVLLALRKLGVQLTPQESSFVELYSTNDMRQFEKVVDDMKLSREKAMEIANASK